MAFEGQFADDCIVVEPIRLDLVAADEHSEGYRQIEAGCLFGELSRC